MGSEITKRLTTGQYARLIPTVADSKKEERNKGVRALNKQSINRYVKYQ